MKNIRSVFCSLLASLALAFNVEAAPEITVNGAVTAELAPPAGSFKSDAEATTPLARTVVSVADQLAGAWQYSALSDITVPKLAILGEIDNSGGGALTGPFSGEIPLMRVNASLRDTINIIAPSSDPYLVTASLDVHGLLQAVGSDGVVTAEITVDPTGPRLSDSEFRSYSGNQTVNDSLPISFQFTGNAEFDLRSALFFFVTRIDAGSHVLADFSNTAIINLTITTLAGDVIPDVVIESASGNFGTAPVPLPSSLVVLGSALAMLGWRNRRRA